MSKAKASESQGQIIVFGAKQIRRTWHAEKWYFSVVDIIGALTDSDNPRNYWSTMKAREVEASGMELSTICVQLKLTAADGKSYKTDCVDTQAAFRIIQSIPSPRDYWYRMKRREQEASGVELSTLCRQLKLTSIDDPWDGQIAVRTRMSAC